MGHILCTIATNPLTHEVLTQFVQVCLVSYLDGQGCIVQKAKTAGPLARRSHCAPQGNRTLPTLAEVLAHNRIKCTGLRGTNAYSTGKVRGRYTEKKKKEISYKQHPQVRQ